MVASFADGALQGAVWALALGLDMGGPLIIESEGWRLEPHHFAERHGLIVLIALGESIVAIGVGAEAGVDAGVVAAAVIGTIVSAALFWLYFDVVALVARRRLENAAPGRERNEIARDSFSYLHFPMVAGIVLVALGLQEDARPRRRRRCRSCPPPRCSAARRCTCSPTSPSAGATCTASAAQRLIAARACVALHPGRREPSPRWPRWPSSPRCSCVLVVYERVRFAELRDRLRHPASAAG